MASLRRIFQTALSCLVLGVPTGGHSEGFDPVDTATCDHVWQRLVAVLPIDVTAKNKTARDSYCVFEQLTIASIGPRRPEIRIARFAFAGVGIGENLREGTPLSRVAVDIDDLRVVPVLNHPLSDYLFDVQTTHAKHDLNIDLHHDPDQNTLTVDRFEVRFPGQSYLSASYEIEGVDLSSVEVMMASIPQATVPKFSIEGFINGVFETYVAPAMIAQLLDGSETPKADMEALRRGASATVTNAPERVLSPSSIGAILAFIDDFPHPNGKVSASLTSTSGLSMMTLVSGVLSGGISDAQGLWGFLLAQDVKLEVSYVYQAFVD